MSLEKLFCEIEKYDGLKPEKHQSVFEVFGSVSYIRGCISIFKAETLVE